MQHHTASDLRGVLWLYLTGPSDCQVVLLWTVKGFRCTAHSVQWRHQTEWCSHPVVSHSDFICLIWGPLAPSTSVCDCYMLEIQRSFPFQSVFESNTSIIKGNDVSLLRIYDFTDVIFYTGWCQRENLGWTVYTVDSCYHAVTYMFIFYQHLAFI